MDVGVVVPQGLGGQFDGWEPGRAWALTVAVAQRAEALGFESVWVYDHLRAFPEPGTQPTLEALATLTALAPLTSRVRLGSLVACAGFRNPALLAKMTATMDVISGGRIDLGLGAGWSEGEWVEFGYGFPPLAERMGLLADSLEIVRGLLRDGRSTFAGSYASAVGAVSEPKSFARPVPLVVGGNGPKVTWRLAARFADELNLDGLTPEQCRDALPVIAERCLEIGRDPASLAVSVNTFFDWAPSARQERIDTLGAFGALGLSRAMTAVSTRSGDASLVDAFAEEARAAGASLAP